MKASYILTFDIGQLVFISKLAVKRKSTFFDHVDNFAEDNLSFEGLREVITCIRQAKALRENTEIVTGHYFFKMVRVAMIKTRYRQKTSSYRQKTSSYRRSADNPRRTRSKVNDGQFE